MSCPRTFVFFRLMVNPKSLYACEKQPSMTGVPPGCWSQLLRRQQTAFPDDNLAYLCIGFETGEVEELAF